MERTSIEQSAKNARNKEHKNMCKKGAFWFTARLKKQLEENHSTYTVHTLMNTPSQTNHKVCHIPGQVFWPLIGSYWRGWSNLIGCGGIRTGVSSQAGQLLLHAEVGALAHAEESGRYCQSHQDEEHAEDGEQQELARLHPGLLYHGDLGQAAPLEDPSRRRKNTLCQSRKARCPFSDGC